MSGRIAFMGSGRFLIMLLILAIVVSLGFGIAGRQLDGPLLDMVAGVHDNEMRLAALSPDQRVLHLWITATLDVLYPLAYGGALANLAARFTTRWKLLAALAGLALIVTDLCENVMIAMMLNGDLAVIPFKSSVTELKWWLFGYCVLLALGLAAVSAFRHHMRASRPNRIASGEY